MRDIVATIQAEQDRDHPGRRRPACWSCRAGRAPARPRSRCTGPPTCSTPTGERLARRGVLVVGPNPTFLRYIGQVLPSLGETGVLLGTVGAAVPRARRAPRRAAATSPRSRAAREMAGVVAAAVRDRQRVPRQPVEPGRRAAAGAAGPRPGRPGRAAAGPALGQAAQRGQADLPPGGRRGCWPSRSARALRRRADLLDAGDLADIRDELAESRELTRELDALWPTLSARAAAHRPVRRPAPAGVGRPPAADAPTGSAAPAGTGRRRARRTRGGRRPTCRCSTRRPSCSATTAPRRRPGRPRRCARRSRYAQGVLDVLDLEEDLDPELLRRHRHRRRRPARRAAAGAPLRLDRRAGRRRPGVGLRARDRRRGAGAVADGLAAADAPLPEPVDDGRRRHRADRRPGRARRRGARCSRRTSPTAGGSSS